MMQKVAFTIALTIICANAALALPGSGTEADPWRIQSLADFNDFAADPDYWDDFTRLETDVNLAAHTYTTAVIAPDLDNSNSVFDGIAFTGVFDGNDHIISNLNIDGGGAGNDYVGLFGRITGGQIMNLRVESGSVRGDRYVGGLVGLSLEGSSISGCYFMGDVNGFECVGGLVGENYGSLSESYTICDVNASEDYAGGLVGRNEGEASVSNCRSVTYVRGREYLGGLLGYNAKANVSGCYSTGTVKGANRAGGLIGQNGDDENEDAQGGDVLNCHSSCDVGDGPYVGGLVGWNNGGRISDCNSTGDVTGTWNFAGGLVGRNDRGNITRCHSMGDVHGHDYVGGLVGYSPASSVWNCYSTGYVRGGEYIGGLIGANGSSVWECYSIGNVRGGTAVGGLVGVNSSIVWDCYSMGDVKGSSYKAGGLVGHNAGHVSNCYSTGDIDGNKHEGGLIGSNYEDGRASNCFWNAETQTHGVTEGVGHFGGVTENVVGLATVVMQMESIFTSAGWDFLGERANGTSEIWQMPAGGGYPALSSLANSGVPFPLAGAGTIGDPYLIGDANELGMVRWYHEDCSFRLTTDIDLSGITWPGAVVPAFGGCFDGNGCKLVNMQISGSGWLGLFGGLAAGGQVKNLGLEGASVRGVSAWVSGLVAENWGTVSNCYSMGDIYGGDYVGGLIGVNYGNLLNSYSASDVNAFGDYVGGLIGRNSLGSVLNCWSIGKTRGEDWVGGLVGFISDGNISDSYSIGEVNGVQCVGGLLGHNSAGDVWGCYFRGTVKGSGRVGGLIGENFGYAYTMSDCYSIASVRGASSVGGLMGKNEGSLRSCYAAGSVGGFNVVGGFVGHNRYTGDIMNCYSIGDTNGVAEVGGFVGHNDYGADVSNSYAVGDVNGITDVGGLVGHNNGSRVSNCFWDIEMQSHGVTESIGNYEGGTVDNVADLLSREMFMEDTFTSSGWDFVGEVANGTDDIWAICSGENYPRFAWQIPLADYLCPNGVTAKDFAFFAAYWLEENCGLANEYCGGTDMDVSGRTDGKDLILFAEDWLQDAVLPVLGPEPSNEPSPLDGSADIGIDSVLSWQSGHGTISHRVYLGTAKHPPFQSDQQDTVFKPDFLAYGTTYYWRVDEVNEAGVTMGQTWSFTTGSLPDPASMPEPNDGAADVRIDPNLGWQPGTDTLSYDVYFGTTSPGTFQGNQAEAKFGVGMLEYGQTYYWRIDAINTHGMTTGPAWSFTTGSLPDPASIVEPEDGAVDVRIDPILQWLPGANATSHDVYFGTTSPGAFQGNQTEASFEAGWLNPEQTYYWRIDEVNGHGTTTGSIWTFTTKYVGR